MEEVNDDDLFKKYEQMTISRYKQVHSHVIAVKLTFSKSSKRVRGCASGYDDTEMGLELVENARSRHHFKLQGVVGSWPVVAHDGYEQANLTKNGAGLT